MLAAVAVALLLVVPAVFPGAHTTPICGTRAIPYQQQALARSPGALWVACRDAGAVLRVDPRTGRTTRRARLGGFRPWAIAYGGGALWVIDRDRAELWRLDAGSGRRSARIVLPSPPASLWFGGGSAWVGFDGVGFARVNASTRRVMVSYEGDGVSAFATDGRRVYAVSHRDNAITRVDLASGRVTTLATGVAPVATAATEQATFAAGALWLTGRGLVLLRVDPARGRTTATIEIGAAGLAVATSGTRLLVASYTARGARRGDPVVARLALVDPRSGRVTSSTSASRPSYLSGLVVQGNLVVTADTVLGRLARLTFPR